MTRRFLLERGSAVFCASAFTTDARGSRFEGAGRPYSPALYYDGDSPMKAAITVFPFAGELIHVPVPLRITSLVTDLSGKSLYIQGQKLGVIEYFQGRKPGIFELVFNPTRLVLVPGSDRAGAEGLIAFVDEESVVIAAKSEGSFRILRLHLQNGEITQIFETRQNSVHWLKIGLPHDLYQALVRVNEQLRLFNLKTGSSTHILPGFRTATWSPDGDWIAGIPQDSDNSVLVNAHNYREVRRFKLRALEWSPDSRYLLGWRQRLRDLRCGFDTHSLEIVEVGTGRTSNVRNSACRFSGGRLFWLSNDLVGLS